VRYILYLCTLLPLLFLFKDKLPSGIWKMLQMPNFYKRPRYIYPWPPNFAGIDRRILKRVGNTAWAGPSRLSIYPWLPNFAGIDRRILKRVGNTAWAGTSRLSIYPWLPNFAGIGRRILKRVGNTMSRNKPFIDLSMAAEFCRHRP
jgi:hypothetical protein